MTKKLYFDLAKSSFACYNEYHIKHSALRSASA